ncbi:MAG: hypothetical protein VXW32_09595 [Myxococcota bacterium]|nr:hypothetical protein [Myxococcota bacterium]
MNDWVQAIYDATGVPLEEENLGLRLHGSTWWLEHFQYPIFAIGDTPSRHASIALVDREGLLRSMERKLSETLPSVRSLLKDLGGEQADAISLGVLCTQNRGPDSLPTSEFDRGWPHFSLRLSAGVSDVEVDLNPYVPEDPFDQDELIRQAEILLQVVAGRRGSH